MIGGGVSPAAQPAADERCEATPARCLHRYCEWPEKECIIAAAQPASSEPETRDYAEGDRCRVCRHWWWKDGKWHSLVPILWKDREDGAVEVVCPACSLGAEPTEPAVADVQADAALIRVIQRVERQYKNECAECASTGRNPERVRDWLAGVSFAEWFRLVAALPGTAGGEE